MRICGDFFFFKQKTAYEMRISDWSSDVCSSDLPSWWASRAWHLGMRREKPTLANTVSVENLGRPSSNFLHRVRRKAIREWEFYHSLLAPDLALLAGRASLNRFTRRARRILWVGSQDYHLYQLTQEQRPDGLPNGPYAAFV